MKITNNFTVEEFEVSETASKYRIDNTIPNKYRINLYNLAITLQTIRDAYGYPIKITSGYRCKELNLKVGGASNSEHTVAAAADIKATKTSNKQLFDCIMKLIEDKRINCRQLIWEYGTKNEPSWIHISVNNASTKPKTNEVLYIGVK